VDAGEPTTARDVGLERALLGGPEHVAGRRQEDDHAVAGEVFARERTGVFGGVDADACLGGARGERGDAGLDRLVSEPRRPGEDEDALLLRPLVRRGRAGEEQRQ
jgi:hypothetical protein